MIHLPQIKMTLSVRGWWEGGGTEEVRPVSAQNRGGVRPESDWIKVHADQEYVLNIDFRRDNKHKVMLNKIGRNTHTRLSLIGFKIIMGPQFQKSVNRFWTMWLLITLFLHIISEEG